MISTTVAIAVRVYSYIRFSTPEQALGDSERRQLANAKKFAEVYGYEFDESLRMADRGLSGYHGDNKTKGALGQFLDSVKSGDVPPGSVLYVENIDRLGREEIVDALQTIIFGLINNGISIATTDAVYDRASLNGGGIWQLIVQIQRAHDESKRKSERLSAAWSQKRKRMSEGCILTSKAPAWLRITDGKFQIIPDAAETVRMIFDLKLKGMGRNAIAKRLNEVAPWRPPFNKKRKTDGWRQSYIAKILSCRSVIGEFQPCTGHLSSRKPTGDAIPDYYPQIVNADAFHAVQKLLAENKGKGGKTGKVGNLFAHLVRCKYCGGPMVYVDKGKAPKGNRYLICDQGRRGVKCKAHSIAYDEFERTVIDNCMGLRPEQVLPNPAEQTKQCNALRTRLSGIVGEIVDNEQRSANLMEQIETTAQPALREKYEARVVKLEADRVDLLEQRKNVESELTKLERNATSFTEWQSAVADLWKALANRNDVDLRLRLRTRLRELIDRIEVFAVGHTKALGYGEDIDVTADVEYLAQRIEETASDVGAESPDADFLDWVTARRQSKHGRFIRVHFKTGIRRDLVPGDSIATGRGLEVDADGLVGWTLVEPSIDILRKMWISQKKHQTRPKGARTDIIPIRSEVI